MGGNDSYTVLEYCVYHVEHGNNQKSWPRSQGSLLICSTDTHFRWVVITISTLFKILQNKM